MTKPDRFEQWLDEQIEEAFANPDEGVDWLLTLMEEDPSFEARLQTEIDLIFGTFAD